MIKTEIYLRANISTKDIIAIEDWCSENIGPRARWRDSVNDIYNWCNDTMFGSKTFYFADNDDAVLFRLTYSEFIDYKNA